MVTIDYRGLSTFVDTIQVNDGDTIIVHQFEADGVTPVDFNGSTVRIESSTGLEVRITIIFDGDYSASNLGRFVINNGAGANGDDVVADLIIKEGSTLVNSFEYSGFPGGTPADPTITTITLEDNVTFEGQFELNDPNNNNENAIINITTGDNVTIGTPGNGSADNFIFGNIRGSEGHQVNLTLGDNNTLYSSINATTNLVLNSSGTTPLDISGSTFSLDSLGLSLVNGTNSTAPPTVTNTDIIANDVTIASSSSSVLVGHQGDDVIEMTGLVASNTTGTGVLVLTSGLGDDTWTIGGDAIHTSPLASGALRFRALGADGAVDDDNDTLIFRPVDQAQLDEFILSLKANFDEIQTSGVPGVNAVGDAYTLPNADDDTNVGIEITQTDGVGKIFFTQFETVIIGDFICFSAGTLIDTPYGQTKVEDLSPGDLVKTLDNGMQAVRWINSRTITKKELAANPHLMPIKIQAGSLGSGLPLRDLIVSPQHRVMISSVLAERMFGVREALVAAKQLVEIDGIDIAEVDEVTYVHFMTNRHEIVFAEGSPTETLFPGKETFKILPIEAIQELFEIFPELKETETEFVPMPARTLVKGRKARQFAMRSTRNKKMVYTRMDELA